MSGPGSQSGFAGTYEEYREYSMMQYINDGETPTEWKNRIWDRLMYFRGRNFHTYSKKNYFCARKALPHLVDGYKCYPKCGIAICFSCNQLVYLGIESLSMGERCSYDGLKGKFSIEKFRYISFDGEHWEMYQHWATACTGNMYRDLDFKGYMEMKQLIPLNKWVAFHHYTLQTENPFGKFRRREPYFDINVNNKFGTFPHDKLYKYLLWLENVTRRIRHIRQKRAFSQIVNNIREMHPLHINRQDWMDKPRSLTPPPLSRKPVALMQRSASAPELKYFPIYSDYKTQFYTRPLPPKGPR